MKCVENCEVMTSSTHSFECPCVFHKEWSRIVRFRKNVKFQNVTTFLISYPIFNKAQMFALSVGKFCTLSFEIMVHSGLDVPL